ncbi:membrane protein [Corynebacterium phage PSonyx]|nr:membrane protein [Corynebacterium phage PSonyx]
MNVMNGLIAVGVTIAVVVFFVILAWLANRWPAETVFGIVAVFVLVTVFICGAYA